MNNRLPLAKMHKISHDLLLLSLSLLVAILTQSSIGAPIELSIDSSWQFALNYFHIHQLILGRDVFFTHGPLGYLLWPKPLANNLFIAALFWFFLKTLLIIAVFSLMLELNKQQKLAYQILIYTLAFFFFSAVHISLLLFLNTTYLLLFNCKGRKVYLYLATAVSILALLIKPGLAVYTLLASYSFLIIDSLINKRWRLIIEISLLHILLYFSGWLLLVHSWAGSIGFLSSSWEFIHGYDAAMSLDKPVCWIYLGGAYALVLLSFLPFMGRKILAKNGPIIFLILLCPTLLYFKYSYNRLNEHIYFITVFLVLFYSYMLIFIADIWRFLVLFLLGLGALQFQLASQSYLGFPVPKLEIASLSGRYFFQQILQPIAYKNHLLALSKEDLSRLKLDLTQLNTKGSSFAIYPNSATIIYAKQLIWQPQPIPQSYTNYTAKLDNLNADFFRQGKGADYIIWHSANTLKEIDQRYLLNSEPNTSFEILNHYQPFKTLANFVILKKSPAQQWSQLRLFHTSHSSWNTWIPVPENSFAVVRARLFTQETVWEKIKRLVYKQGATWIDYQFTNGSIESYRLILATAENGIWIKPFIHALSNNLETIEKLPQTTPATAKANYKIEKISIKNGFLYIKGWGYIEHRNIAGQLFHLILSQKNKHYFFPAISIPRIDLQGRLPEMASDPEYLGFSAKINMQKLPSGPYQLRLYLVNGKDQVINLNDKNLILRPADQHRNSIVKSIRLRHQPTDFFQENITLEWLGAENLKK